MGTRNVNSVTTEPSLQRLLIYLVLEKFSFQYISIFSKMLESLRIWVRTPSKSLAQKSKSGSISAFQGLDSYAMTKTENEDHFLWETLMHFILSFQFITMFMMELINIVVFDAWTVCIFETFCLQMKL